MNKLQQYKLWTSFLQFYNFLSDRIIEWFEICKISFFLINKLFITIQSIY